MKKKYFVMILALLLTLSACGKQEEASAATQNAGGKQEEASAATQNAEEKQEEASAASQNAGGKVDVDLTALSSTMVYSEVYNILTAPERYIGKTVKMAGSYSSFLDEATGAVYRVCMIADATACCAQGMEFVLKDGMAYPEMESDITVVGTFELYDENGTTYCHLVNAELV